MMHHNIPIHFLKKLVSTSLCLLAITGITHAQEVASPNEKLQVSFELSTQGEPSYSVKYNKKTLIEKSPLGLQTNIGDFSKGLRTVGHEVKTIDTKFKQSRIKTSTIHYQANELTVTLKNAQNQGIQITFRASNNDLAFRYTLPREGETGSVRILKECTGFKLPAYTTTFLTPQSNAMVGWKRTKPSYEEDYTADIPMNTPSKFGHGYTFPCLFRIGNKGWALISETDVDSRYCASHLSDYHTGSTGEGLYTIAFPMPEENNGNGTVEPAFSLPGSTPWRTITLGETLQPIVETTIPWNVVEPRYTTKQNYKMGRGTWSWILWQDESINFKDLSTYIDFAATMGFEYVLVDNWWDTKIGRDKIKELIQYAHSKNVDIFLWYSSSGYWNDIEQGPINRMDNSILRKQEMRWMKKLGVKGIKVDFFGGDKQETMRLYEEILSDADDHGLMVIFHGCTLPRGWERMYPNYVGSEAILASENMIFSQEFCDKEAFNTCLHPFIRNTVGCMEYGGCFLNKRMSRNNNSGKIRRTSDAFQLATTVLFQNPIQNFALAPNNLNDAPQLCINFLKDVPTTWDETRFIDGYPGKYVVLARRHANQWYIAGVNASQEPMKLELQLPLPEDVSIVKIYTDGKDGAPMLKEQKLKKDKTLRITIQPQGGFIATN